MDRGVVRERLKLFLAHSIDKAGGPKALSHKLERYGFTGRDGPYDERTVRAWRGGRRMPSPDIVFGIAMLCGVSLDHYVFGEELQDKLANDIARLLKDRDQLMVWMLEVRERLGFPAPDRHMAPEGEPEERLQA